MSDKQLKEILTAIVSVALIGGCTYTLSNTTTPSTKIIDACLKMEGYTWDDGECKRLPQ